MVALAIISSFVAWPWLVSRLSTYYSTSLQSFVCSVSHPGNNLSISPVNDKSIFLFVRVVSAIYSEIFSQSWMNHVWLYVSEDDIELNFVCNLSLIVDENLSYMCDAEIACLIKIGTEMSLPIIVGRLKRKSKPNKNMWRRKEKINLNWNKNIWCTLILKLYYNCE